MRPLRRGTLFPGLLLALAAGALASPSGSAQQARFDGGSTPRYERGTVGAGLLLRQLDGVKRVLMIGAHPDDEDTALLAALARGSGVQTAYLSLTRGDGGQNLVGPELGVGLGAVRTGELLAARALDGGRQFFTRAFDYGYSKSAEEAFRKWPRDELLRDVTWVVRTFRPHVIVSVFSGTPADGHGQHQAAGVMAHEVFEVAGDPTRYADQLDDGVEAWQPTKLYRLAWRDRESATVQVPTGSYDPLLGRSHYQLAMESRSQHRSQDMGVGQPPGPRASSLTLVATAPGTDVDPDDDALFAGVDTTLAGLVDGLPPARRRAARPALERYRTAVHRATERLDALHPGDAAPPLARAVRQLRVLDEVTRRSERPVEELRRVLERKLRVAEEALMDASGVVMDVRVADDLVVPGQTVRVWVDLWNGGSFEVVAADGALELPGSWHATPLSADEAGRSVSVPPWARGRGGARVVEPGGETNVAPGEVVRWVFDARVGEDADPSEPYYLREERDGAMYRWPDEPRLRALPRNPPLVHATTDFRLRVASGGAGEVAEAPIGARRAGAYVGVDRAKGEFREPVHVVPAVSVSAEPGVMVVPAGSTDTRAVSVSLRAWAPDGAVGRVHLRAPDGWEVEPNGRDFTAEVGEERSFVFRVRPPGETAAGRYALEAVAETDAGGFRRSVALVDYPHIEREVLLEPAETRVTVVSVEVAEELRVGYVMGSGDDVPEALGQLGVDVELLGPADVREGDLSGFDVIVTGIRAYETRPDLRSANERILDFAREGGTVLVQYNKYPFSGAGYAPRPVAISRPHDRVTDESSPFSFIHPDNPVFTSPNRIGPEDFEGWITERGLYFLGEWEDEHMTPVLELTDPGEAPKRGSIVVASVGRGLWVYTGLSFFRQLPEGVPGAYRLFANLVSLTAEKWRAWEEER